MPAKARARLHAVVRGRVQGVGYRWFAQREATALGLDGGVRNLHDRTVEVEAEGPRDHLEELVSRLREGPFGADVSDVEVSWFEPAAGWSGFEIWGSR